MKYTRLSTVLAFAAMLLILGLLVANVTNSAPVLPSSRQAPPTVEMIIEDGTISHPYYVDYCPCGVPYDIWSVLTVNGHEKWQLNWLYDVRGGPNYALYPGDYISYKRAEYQISGIDRKALTMRAVILGN
jgi:hypothetical protein